MELSASLVKDLRARTGAGFMDCKKALEEAKGDIETAVELLRKKGLAELKKRAAKITKEGLIDSYVHAGGKIGVLVEVNCETDFVARNEDFKEFVHNIALHIAASNPLYIERDDVPPEVIEKEIEIYKAQGLEEEKPLHVIEKIAEGRIEKFYQSVCLLDQPYIKNPDIKIEDYLGEIATKIGENIVIRRFVRYELGVTI